jgi:hypothetical protein
MPKIDLLKIDHEAGKPWGQLVRDEELGKRHRAIRTKHRLKAQTEQKRVKDRKDKS